MKMCIACGMPMTAISDYALYDISKNYCKHCARSDGSMQSFEERLTHFTAHLIKNHAIDAAVAKQTAYVILKKLPAWKKRD